MTTFVLVHGAWHGAWCWYRLAPLLEAAGHRVVTPDLPAHGLDRTPAAQVHLVDYARTVAAALERTRETAVLLGHSLGGMVVSQAAELVPERVRRLIYLNAFLPGDGDSCSRLSEEAHGSLLNRHTVADAEAGLLRFGLAGMREALYADCPPESVALAARCLTPEPLAPLMEPVRLTPERYGRLPRDCIESTEDRAIPVAHQHHMRSARGCDRVVTLPGSHSPFFSQPELLAAHLGTLGA